MNINELFNKQNKIDSNKVSLFKATTAYNNLVKKHGDISISEILYKETHNIEDTPLCPVCLKNKLKFKQFTTGYTSTCSKKCSNQSNTRIQKIQETKLKRHGSAGFNNNPLANITRLEKYGSSVMFKTDHFKHKAKQTILEKYNVLNISSIPEVKEKKRGRTGNSLKSKQYHYNKLINHELHKNLLDKEWLIEQYSVKNLTIVDIAEQLDVAYSTVNNYLDYHNIPKNKWFKSSVETKLNNYLISLGINTITSCRTIIPPKEIDIYLPDYSLAIEVNGLFWHSCNSVERDSKEFANYHLNKTLECTKKNIQLLHFTDKEIIEKFDIVTSIIRSKLKLNERLYARKCIIKTPSVTECRDFLIKNHIQGYCIFSECRGLYFDNVLVALMTIGKPRFNKKYNHEILRYCSRLNLNVIGGFSRLLNSFKLSSVISYANRRWSDGSVYQKNGFKLLSASNPNFFYIDKDNNIHSRIKFQKHKLNKILECYDNNLTTEENIFNHQFRKIYDCGSYVFIK